MRTLGRIFTGCLVTGVVLFVLIVGGLALFYGATSVYGLYLAQAQQPTPITGAPVVQQTQPPVAQGTEVPVVQGTEAPVVAQETPPPVVVVDPVLPAEVQDVWNVDRREDAYNDFRLHVNANGEVAMAAMVFGQGFDSLHLRRVVPDDILVSAKVVLPDGREVDITDKLEIIAVPAGGTGKRAVDKWLEANDVNIVDGELLPQNSRTGLLQNIQAG